MNLRRDHYTIQYEGCPQLEYFITLVFCALVVSWAGFARHQDHTINLFYAVAISVSITNVNHLQLSTTDLLVLASMKNAAKCDT